ncbi:YqbF domain-containing protein [Alkalihalobacillus sp. FSL W8-0930]
MFEVTLDPKKGKSFDVGGTIFKAGVPRSVSDDLGEYLKGNEFFLVSRSDSDNFKDHGTHTKNEGNQTPSGENGENNPPGSYTEKDLLKLKQAEQEGIIQSLNGDPGQAKNAQERVALILKLQEIAQEAGLE